MKITYSKYENSWYANLGHNSFTTADITRNSPNGWVAVVCNYLQHIKYTATFSTARAAFAYANLALQHVLHRISEHYNEQAALYIRNTCDVKCPECGNYISAVDAVCECGFNLEGIHI